MTVGAGTADLKVHITNNRGMSVPSKVNQTPQGYQVTYVPTDPGTYSVHVTYGGLDVPGSTFCGFVFIFLSLRVSFIWASRCHEVDWGEHGHPTFARGFIWTDADLVFYNQRRGKGRSGPLDPAGGSASRPL